jgi:hypothetical protein
MKKVLLFLWVIVCFLRAHAQVSGSVWQTVQMPVRFSEKLIWHNDAGYRTIGCSLKANAFLYRTGIRYHFSNKTEAAAGFALFFARAEEANDKSFRQEFRLWQEVVQQQQMAPAVILQLRFRTEQRFFEASSQPAYTAYRFRYRANIIGRLHEKLSVQIGYEHLHQLEHGQLRFNQLRIQPAMIYNTSNNIQIQVMYMYLKTPDQKQNALWLTYFIHLSYANKNRQQS